MKKTCFILAVLVTLSFIAREANARIGETITQCDQRYGTHDTTLVGNMFPLLPGATNRTYYFEGWRIQAAFVDGRVVMHKYSKKNVQQMNDDELHAILSAEGAGGTWKEQPQSDWSAPQLSEGGFVRIRPWSNSHGLIAYFADIMQVNLVIEAPSVASFRKANTQIERQQRKASIPDF